MMHTRWDYIGGTDKTVVVWKDADGRDMMLYPFYVKHHVVYTPTPYTLHPTPYTLAGLDR